MMIWEAGGADADAYAEKDARDAWDESSSVESCFAYSFSCESRFTSKRESDGLCTIRPRRTVKEILLAVGDQRVAEK